MGEWLELDKNKIAVPCRECQTGFSKYLHKVENGKAFVKMEMCSDTCKQLKQWLAVQFREGQNES